MGFPYVLERMIWMIGEDVIRFLKKIIIFGLSIGLIGAFGYFVILPKLLPLDYKETVETYASKYNVEESLVYAVIFCESGFDTNAHSRAGAKGLMQVTTETGWWASSYIEHLKGKDLDLTDPETNIAIGCWYLSWLTEKFQGEKETALAGYNAGHGNVGKWLADIEKSTDGVTLNDIPFGETKNYVKKVVFMEKIYKICYGM